MKAGRFFQWGLIICAGLMIVGCAAKPEVVTPTESSSTVVPSATNTPSATLLPTPTAGPSSRSNGTPTPTPAVVSVAPIELPSAYTGTLPRGAIARLGMGFFTDIELSPDGELLAVGTSTGLTMYDAASLEILWTDTTARAVGGFSWSADSTMIAGSFQNSPVVISWDALSGERLYTLAGHSDSISRVHWSPTENLLATSGRDGAIILWDGETSTRLRTLMRTDPGHPDFDYHKYGFNQVWFEFSPDGTMIASGYAPGGSDTFISEMVIVWDVQTGQQLHVLEEGPRYCFEITWSPDSKLVATVSKIWDVSTGQVVGDLENDLTGEGCPRTAWAYRNWEPSPDGSLLANVESANVYTKILKVCSADGEQLYFIRDINAFIEWSPDGQEFIARTDPDNRLVIYSAIGEPLRELGITDYCLVYGCTIFYSPDWARFYYLAGEHRETLGVWDINNESARTVIATESSPLLRLAWSSDGKRLATIPDDSGRMTIWDIESLEPMQALDGHYFTWSPDLLTVVGGGGDRNEDQNYFIIKNTLTGEMVKTTTGGPVHSLAWAPKGDYLTVGGGWGVYLRNPQDGELIQYFEQGQIPGLSWSPDGSRVASVDTGGKVAIWDVSTEERIFLHEIVSKSSYTGTFAYDENFAWSPSGDSLAFIEPGNNLLIYSNDPMRLIHRIEIEEDLVVDLSFSPDGKQIALISEDQEDSLSTLRVWDTSSGELVWDSHNSDSPVSRRDGLTSISWSPDGRYIAAGTGPLPFHGYIVGMYEYTNYSEPGQVILLDAETGHVLSTFEGHTGGVEDVAFSPDGSVLASASLDGTVILWDVSQ